MSEEPKKRDLALDLFRSYKTGFTKKKKIVEERTQTGRLLVQCSSTAWATQLNLVGVSLLETIRASAPGALVESLEFIGPTAPSWKRGLRTISNGRGPRDTYG
jgi:predicted nucleic acid-binding Zn ribbon protein